MSSFPVSSRVRRLLAFPVSSRVRRLLAAVCVVAVVLGAFVGSAGAHTDLESSVPGASTTVGGDDVGRVELFFFGPIEDDAPRVEVDGPSGLRVGEVEVVDATTVVATFAPLDVAGIHTVTWTVIASDGDAVTGEVVFEFEPVREAPAYLLLDRERSFVVFVVVAIAAVVALGVIVPLGRRRRRSAVTGHTIEILYHSECDDAADMAESLHVALEGLGRDVEITMVEVRDDAHAAELGFRGSPSALLDGADLFDASGAVGFGCRLYETPDGLRGRPDDEQVAAALARRLADPAR
ncbi:MAG: copper resistance protein CopC [Acidimicrobiales bacterium]